MDPNATTIERLAHYVETEQYEKAEALAALADYLEECFHWDIDLYPEFNNDTIDSPNDD